MSCCNQIAPPPFYPYGCTPCNASTPIPPPTGVRVTKPCAECKIIVEAETLAPGSEATAEERRLDCGSYAIFLGIPRGDVGPVGPTGAKGVKGDKGDPGLGLAILGTGVYKFVATDGKELFCSLTKLESGEYGWKFTETNPIEVIA